MPDPITPSERAAIASYTGPIRKIPTGVSGIPNPWEGISWKDQIKRDMDHGKKVQAAMAKRRDAIRGPIPAMAVRDGETRTQTIARFKAEQRTHSEIARFFGITGAGVVYHLRRAAKGVGQ